MNDTELDQLLDAWQAPAPSRSLRRRIRGSFPRPGRPFISRFRWALASVVFSVTVAFAIGQAPPDGAIASSFDVLREWYSGLIGGIELRREIAALTRIRESHPEVYIDGVHTGPAELGHSRMLLIRVPGGGVYMLTLVGGLQGWRAAGYLAGNSISFDADGHHVRVEMSQRITDAQRLVYIRRQEAP